MIYKGVELVNCGPPSRKGPFIRFPHGKYQGRKVEDIIVQDPHYFMWAVKEWLDVSPTQALIFELHTGGGEIPSQYIKENKEETSKIPEVEESSPKVDKRDEMIYNRNLDLVPNYDFDPSTAPPWWREFKQRSLEERSLYRRYTLYQEYQDKDWQKVKRELSNGR